MNLILKGLVEPPEPERAAEAREARRSGECYTNNCHATSGIPTGYQYFYLHIYKACSFVCQF